MGWIDGIMMSYNFRLMHSEKMRKAVDACTIAGIGLTAMKTQGGGSVRTSTETELELAGSFLQKGFTDAQAKLKAVWENQAIASICSEMPNTTILMANVASRLEPNPTIQHRSKFIAFLCTGDKNELLCWLCAYL